MRIYHPKFWHTTMFIDDDSKVYFVKKVNEEFPHYNVHEFMNKHNPYELLWRSLKEEIIDLKKEISKKIKNEFELDEDKLRELKLMTTFNNYFPKFLNKKKIKKIKAEEEYERIFELFIKQKKATKNNKEGEEYLINHYGWNFF